MVAKIWNSHSKALIANKFEKIKRLYQLDLLEKINDVRILKSVSYQGQIIGYLMNLTHFREFNTVLRTRSETLYYLSLVRSQLRNFEKLGIIYGDLSDANIMVSNREICFCDLDNVAYQEFGIDLMPTLLDEFIACYGKLDEKAMSYMHNIFTIKELCYLEDYREVEAYIESRRIPREISPHAYRLICEQMLTITPYYEGHYIIDYAKEKYKQRLWK